MKTKLFKVSVPTREDTMRCKHDCASCPNWVGEECMRDRHVLLEPPKIDKKEVKHYRNMGWSDFEGMNSDEPLSPSHPDGGLPLLGGMDRLISQSNRHFAQFNEEHGESNGASRVRKLITQLDEFFVPGWRPALALSTQVLTNSEIQEDVEYYNLILEEEALEQAVEDAMNHIAETLDEAFYDPMNPEEELLEMEEPAEDETKFYTSDSPWVVVFEVVPRTILEVWTPAPELTIFKDRITRTRHGIEMHINVTPFPKPEAEMTTEELKEHSRRQQQKLFEIMLPENMNPVAGLNHLINTYADTVRGQVDKKKRFLRTIASAKDEKFHGKTEERCKRLDAWATSAISTFNARRGQMRQALKDAFTNDIHGTGHLRTIKIERSGQVPKHGTHQRLGNRRMRVGSYYSKLHGLIRLGEYHDKHNNLREIGFREMKSWVTWSLNQKKISRYEAKCLWNLWKFELKMVRQKRKIGQNETPNEVRG